MPVQTWTPLFDRNPQHGWYDYGNYEQHPGNVWFVRCAPVGSDLPGWGMNPKSPFATIAYAVAQCVAGQGDVIYVLPGHVETLAAAGDLSFNVAHIKVIGIGDGTLTPVIDLTTIDTVDVDIDAASVWLENLVFQANLADIVAAIDVNATDFTMVNCRCIQAGGALNALIWVQDAAAAGSDRMTLLGNSFIDAGALNTNAVNFAGTGAQHIVRGNYFNGNWLAITLGGAGAITAATVAENYINNLDAITNDTGINFAAGATGLLIHNYASTGVVSANQITAAAMVKCQNYGGITSDANGLLEPVAT